MNGQALGYVPWHSRILCTGRIAPSCAVPRPEYSSYHVCWCCGLNIGPLYMSQCSGDLSSLYLPNRLNTLPYNSWVYSTEHDTQPIAYLICKQAIPYQTRGDTCCLGVSTPMNWSLANSSMTKHITWWNPTVFTIPTLLKSQHRSSPWSNHISMDGRPSITKT
jgi:hypothetical protein